MTTPARTVNDCAAAGELPDLVRQAVGQGLDRGLFTRRDVAPARAYLARFEAVG